MVTPALLSVLLVGLASPSFAQTPQPAPKPPAAQAPARRASSTARLTLDVEVTEVSGKPLADATVRLAGPVDREGTTDASGATHFTNLRAGTYRVHAERDGFITLEREVSLGAGRPVPVALALAAAPAPPPAPAPPTTPTSAPAAERNEARPVGQSSTTEVPQFAERNFIGRSEPQKVSVVGCTGYGTTRIVQVREPMDDVIHEDADETLYLVAGDATLRMGGREQPLVAGALVVVPRATRFSLARRGRNPAILISVLSGPACPDAK